LPCPLTLSCPPNAEFLDPPMLRNNLWQKWSGHVHPVAMPL